MGRESCFIHGGWETAELEWQRSNQRWTHGHPSRTHPDLPRLVCVLSEPKAAGLKFPPNHLGWRTNERHGRKSSCCDGGVEEGVKGKGEHGLRSSSTF